MDALVASPLGRRAHRDRRAYLSFPYCGSFGPGQTLVYRGPGGQRVDLSVIWRPPAVPVFMPRRLSIALELSAPRTCVVRLLELKSTTARMNTRWNTFRHHIRFSTARGMSQVSAGGRVLFGLQNRLVPHMW